MNNNSKLNLTVSRGESRIVCREVFRAGAVPGIKKVDPSLPGAKGCGGV